MYGNTTQHENGRFQRRTGVAHNFFNEAASGKEQ